MGGPIAYDIDALADGGTSVAVAWTEHLPTGADFRGLSLYEVGDGLITAVRHATIGDLPT